MSYLPPSNKKRNTGLWIGGAVILLVALIAAIALLYSRLSVQNALPSAVVVLTETAVSESMPAPTVVNRSPPTPEDYTEVHMLNVRTSTVVAVLLGMILVNAMILIALWLRIKRKKIVVAYHMRDYDMRDHDDYPQGSGGTLPPPANLAAKPSSPVTDTRAIAQSQPLDVLERYPDVSLPKTTVLHQPCFLRVTVTQQPVDEWLRQQRMALPIAIDKQETHLDVLVTAADFEIVGDAYRSLVVPRNRDTDPIAFQLIPRSEGEKKIKIEFFHNRRYVGGLTVSTIVNPSEALSAPSEAPKQGIIRIDHSAIAPDLTILISESREESSRMAYRFKLHAPTLGLYFYPIKEPLTFTGSPSVWMEGLYEELGGMHRLRIRGHSAETLRTIGADLYEKLFPRELRELWQRRIRGHVRSIMIISDEPWIPWEIIRPSHQAEDGTVVEDGYLCETYLLARWIPGSPPPGIIRVHAGAVIAPEQAGLRHAEEEVQFMRANLGEITDIEPTLAAVRGLLRDGGYQLVHFICHGRFNPEKHEQSMIFLQDMGELKARDIAGERRNFGKNRPFVFLNACETSRAEISLVGIGSWAEKFIGAESGGFLGSSWDVTDPLAARFSQSFYRELLEGKTIGQAVQEARSYIRREEDPTWLAYTLYADPLARVVFMTSPSIEKTHSSTTRVCSTCGSSARPNARFCSQCGQGLDTPTA